MLLAAVPVTWASFLLRLCFLTRRVNPYQYYFPCYFALILFPLKYNVELNSLKYLSSNNIVKARNSVIVLAASCEFRYFRRSLSFWDSPYDSTFASVLQATASACPARPLAPSQVWLLTWRPCGQEGQAARAGLWVRTFPYNGPSVRKPSSRVGSERVLCLWRANVCLFAQTSSFLCKTSGNLPPRSTCAARGVATCHGARRGASPPVPVPLCSRGVLAPFRQPGAAPPDSRHRTGPCVL